MRNQPYGFEIFLVKFMYSENATKNSKTSPYFCPMYLVPINSKVKISQNFVAFSEYINFTQDNEFRSFFGRIEESIICFREWRFTDL